ncbi:MAG: hypothetical protein WD512_12840 [Candidatus Paceibacterota bacterium]
MKTHEEIRKAKETLEKHGYQTENLWHVDDVKDRYNVESDSEALGILHDALTNDATMERIWFAIDFHAENEGFERK